MQRADVAMYQAKRGGSGAAFYQRDRDDSSVAKLTLGTLLRSAVDEGSIDVHFQPKVDPISGTVMGAEALARWTHPERGAIPPSTFIPVAEQTGLIIPLTFHVLHEAMRQAGAWYAAGLELDISVNVSARALLERTMPARIEGLLRFHQLPAHRLILEVTESAMLAESDNVVPVLERLVALGVTISVDDFGTGFSSLEYLKRLPVGELKIDRSFVLGLATDERDRAIVSCAVDLGHRLGLRVVAEGVESVEVRTALTQMGCDQVQGFLFAPPSRPRPSRPRRAATCRRTRRSWRAAAVADGVVCGGVVSPRIVVFGATGYTGELVASSACRARRRAGAGRALARAARGVGGVAGRRRDESARRWRSRSPTWPTRRRCARSWRPTTCWCRRSARSRASGAPAVDAAIDARAHYLDSTGEGAFIRTVFEDDGPRAQAAGCALLTAFGCDWVPGNVAGALALQEAGQAAVRVAIGYYATGAGMGSDATSGGTQASVAGAMLSKRLRVARRTHRDRAQRQARVVVRAVAWPPGAFVLRIGDRALRVAAAAAGAARGRPVPRLVGVDVAADLDPVGRDERGHGDPGRARRAQRPGGEDGQGLDRRAVAEDRERTGTLVLAQAFDASGKQLSDVRLEGRQPLHVHRRDPRLGRPRRSVRGAARHRRPGPRRRLRPRRPRRRDGRGRHQPRLAAAG